MAPAEALRARPRLAARLAFAAAALVLAGAGGAYAWLRAFSTFKAYDDEGYFLVLVRHLLAGRAIYDDVPTVYGPAYLAYRWLLNGACGLPLGTDGLRWTMLAAWLAAVLLVSWITRLLTRGQRLCGGFALAAAGFGAMHLYALANEPGHPHELGLLLLLGGLGGFAALRERRPALAALILGLAVGALTATKLNLGALLGPPALLLVLADERSALRVLRWPLLAAALALPWVLMHAHVAQPWAQGLAAVAGAGVLSASVLAPPRRADRRSERGLGLVLVGAAVALLVSLGFAVLHGSTLAGMYRAIVLASARFTTEILLGGEIPGWAVASAALALGGALLVRARGERLPKRALAAAKAAWGLATLAALVGRPAWLIPALLPFAWLVLADTPLRAARFPFVLCAPLQALQVFPVGGSQVSLGTILLVPLAATALSDGRAALGLGRAPDRLAAVLAGGSVLGAGFVLVGLVLGLAPVYERQERPALPGVRWTRFDETTGARARFLADTLAGSCDTFLSVRGDNSLYAWTGIAPASGVIVSNSWRLLDADQQAELARAHAGDLAAAAAGAPRVLVLDNRRLVPADLRAELDFFQGLERSFRPAAAIGTDELCVPREAAEPRFASCVLLREAQLGAPGARLALRWPAAAEGGALERVQVASVRRGLLFADSALPDARYRVRLWDGDGLLLGGTAGGSVPLERLARATDLRLELPQPLPVEHAADALVRFLGARDRRILSLPVVLVRTRG